MERRTFLQWLGDSLELIVLMISFSVIFYFFFTSSPKEMTVEEKPSITTCKNVKDTSYQVCIKRIK